MTISLDWVQSQHLICLYRRSEVVCGVRMWFVLRAINGITSFMKEKVFYMACIISWYDVYVHFLQYVRNQNLAKGQSERIFFMEM